MQKLESLPLRQAVLIEPMACLAVAKLPEGPVWIYEIKLDGYRALAINSKGKLSLVSRKRKSFNRQYPHILEALTDLPKNTVVDGEIVAWTTQDGQISTCFNILAVKRPAFAISSLICSFMRIVI